MVVVVDVVMEAVVVVVIVGVVAKVLLQYSTRCYKIIWYIAYSSMLHDATIL